MDPDGSLWRQYSGAVASQSETDQEHEDVIDMSHHSNNPHGDMIGANDDDDNSVMVGMPRRTSSEKEEAD